jgi:hypothetical protein
MAGAGAGEGLRGEVAQALSRMAARIAEMTKREFMNEV